MIKITTSFVDNFVAAATPYLTAEIDGRPDGLNGGRTAFMGGESPYFLIYKSDDVIVNNILISVPGARAVYKGIGYATTQKEMVMFRNEKTSIASKNVDLDFTYLWLGNDLGVITPERNTLKAQIRGVAVARIDYKTKAYIYQLLGLPAMVNGTSEYDVLVHIEGGIQ